jgi:hypothetical protein
VVGQVVEQQRHYNLDQIGARAAQCSQRAPAQPGLDPCATRSRTAVELGIQGKLVLVP